MEVCLVITRDIFLYNSEINYFNNFFYNDYLNDN
jgi:hypothetical protein